jgi:hypothetical protein
VRFVEFTPDRKWERVTLGNGKSGYVSSQYIRSAIEYRAFFKQIGGKWNLTAFVAGD